MSGVVLIAAGVTFARVGLGQWSDGEQNSIRYVVGSVSSQQPPLDQHSTVSSEAADLVEPLGNTLVRVDSGSTRGSGVVLREEGLVVTSDQVVGQNTHVAVSLDDGRLLTGRTLGTDPVTGLAVVDLPGRGYATPATAEGTASALLASAYTVGIGDTGRVVITEGDLDPVPTGFDRQGLSRIDGVFALSAPSDPLAWGGPLVDADATVLGITIWTDETQSYVLPIDVVDGVVDDIAENRQVVHAWLGIEGHDAVDPAGGKAGVQVTNVLPEGPSSDVLQAGDVIVAMGEQPVSGMPDLVLELRRHRPGDRIDVSYRRGNPPTTYVDTLLLTVRPPGL